MKTASIGHRVADFLSHYPPFRDMDEAELLELARGGRVQFHECDEIVFQQGQARKAFVYVIQQGVVRLVQETDRGELLRDIRGDGDLLGIGCFSGNPKHLLTARTDTDVILYALPSDSFAALVDQHPRAARFLSAYFSVSDPSKPDDRENYDRKPLLGTRPIDWMCQVASDLRSPVTCTRGMPVRQVAQALAQRRGSAAIVTESEGAPIGLVTLRALSDRVATGELPPDAPVERIMGACPPVAPSGLEAGNYLIRMLESGQDHLAITQDGRPDTRLFGVVSRDDLAITEGATLLRILDEVARAQDVKTLAGMSAKAEAFLASALGSPEALRWLGPVAVAMKTNLLRQMVTLAEVALEAEGLPPPALARCWVFFGATARNEVLTRHNLEYGLIYETPENDANSEVSSYLQELDKRVMLGMSDCGFGPPGSAIVAARPSACRSVADWKHALSGWIRDPIENRVYRATPLFDLRAAFGDITLVRELSGHIDAEKRENPNFVRLLANDSMESLPPLTFFHGLVIDDAGTEAEILDLKHATLRPVVDVARTLALDTGCTRTSTLDRLRDATDAFGEEYQLIAETSAAFTNALYQRARAGFSDGTDGSRINPRKLTRYEQTLLKSGFRAVVRLLEFAGRRYGLLPQP
jgi:CBS domain-containing protein